ncbi:MAG: host attachment protein [Deltaproteobacteria bacterium]|nr:host attachment protein [Deltaproteobacteria bacterium]
MIPRTCVVVADGGRARLFTIESEVGPDLADYPHLIEREGMVNAAVGVSAMNHSDDHGTGRRTMFRAGPTHGYEDRWDREEIRLKRKFARDVAEEALRFATEAGVFQVLLVAEPRMLGLLRKHHGMFEKAHIRCAEHAGDVTKLNAAAVHQWMAAAGLVAAPATLAAVA